MMVDGDKATVNQTIGKEKRTRGSRFWRFLKRFMLYSFLFVILVIAVSIIFYNSTLYKAGESQEGYLALTNATVLIGEQLETHDETSVLIETTAFKNISLHY